MAKHLYLELKTEPKQPLVLSILYVNDHRNQRQHFFFFVTYERSQKAGVLVIAKPF